MGLYLAQVMVLQYKQIATQAGNDWYLGSGLNELSFRLAFLIRPQWVKF